MYVHFALCVCLIAQSSAFTVGRNSRTATTLSKYGFQNSKVIDTGSLFGTMTRKGKALLVLLLTLYIYLFVAFFIYQTCYIF